MSTELDVVDNDRKCVDKQDSMFQNLGLPADFDIENAHTILYQPSESNDSGRILVSELSVGCPVCSRNDIGVCTVARKCPVCWTEDSADDPRSEAECGDEVVAAAKDFVYGDLVESVHHGTRHVHVADGARYEVAEQTCGFVFTVGSEPEWLADVIAGFEADDSFVGCLVEVVAEPTGQLGVGRAVWLTGE